MRETSIYRLVQINQFHSQRRGNNYAHMMPSIFLAYMLRENVKIEPNSGVDKLLLAVRKWPGKNTVLATAILRNY
jgi:hypothetical protein